MKKTMSINDRIGFSEPNIMWNEFCKMLAMTLNNDDRQPENSDASDQKVATKVERQLHQWIEKPQQRTMLWWSS